MDNVETANQTYQPRELQAQVDAAIQHILVGGQSYRLGNRSLTRADLSLLLKMRDSLAAEVAGEDGSTLLPGTAVAFFEGR